jgi:O-antigen/teichoic acid export membrane protein
MVTLCLGSLVVLAGGNVQSLLLMSGRSGWGAANKAMVMVVNVTGNLILIPRVGIEGAALTWTVSMGVDMALAAYQVRRGLGVSPAFLAIGGTLLAVSGCVAAPALLVVAVAGQGTLQLAVGLVGAAVMLLTYCLLDRRRLRLDEIAHLRSRGRARLARPSI